MDLGECKKLVDAELIKFGLKEKGWSFCWISAKRELGHCNYFKKQICLSMDFVMLDGVTEYNIKDTILHEIAHALVGVNHNHDLVWIRKAIEIGCSGERSANIGIYSKVAGNNYLTKENLMKVEAMINGN